MIQSDTTVASRALDRLRTLGYEIELLGADRIRYRYTCTGAPPAQARPLIGVLAAHKEEAIELLSPNEGWIEDRARCELVEAWDWADEAAPSGGWASLPAPARDGLQAALSPAYDDIDRAFRTQSPEALAIGLAHFRAVVLTAKEGRP